MKIYNTLSHQIEEFVPITPPHVGMYSCGPTVYDYQHIGHMRRYVGDDILLRVLKLNGYDVKHVMNITDVGHLTSDSDTGEDKMEKGSKKFGKSVWEIAKMFEQQFKDSASALNINLPKDLMHATDYIPQQIELVKALEEKGFTYKTSDGVYFDTSKFPDYFKFSGQNPEKLEGGRRIDLGEKKNISDFALWKFSSKDEKRQMEWESPWGIGFPGWHVECSAMAMEALGARLDIHTGGIDHINIHHTNEIAQSECATGEKPFAKYWIHHNFLVVDGQKMSKSLGNFITVEDVIEKGFDPLALRYLYLQTHYRQEMNFTWEALEAAQTALNKLRNEYLKLGDAKIGCAEFEKRFKDAVDDDLNISMALSVVWDLLKSDNPGSAKAESILKFDEVLGLGLKEYRKEEVKVPEEVSILVGKREEARANKDFDKADNIRNEIEEKGFTVEDSENGPVVKSK